MRKFEKISIKQFEKDFSNYENIENMYNDLELPKRGTSRAAGYDFHAPFDFTLKPGEIIKMPTGIKALMEDNEFLMLVVRSSTGFKYNVRLCNQVGVIDADYYNNEQNEGHFSIAFQNEGEKPWIVIKGDRVAQGIFVQYQTVDIEESVQNIRNGGIGSTNVRGENNE